MNGKRLRTGAGTLVLAAVLGAPGAFAADMLDTVEIAPALPPDLDVAGYVDAHVGMGAGGEDIFVFGTQIYESEWDTATLGGAARLAVPVLEDMSVQFDAWFNVYRYRNQTCNVIGGFCFPEEDFSSRQPPENNGNPNGAGSPDYGVAGHLTWGIEDLQIGGMASMGRQGDYGGYVTGALEAAANFDSLRLYGQVGYTQATTGFADEDDDHALYAHGVVAYYLDPDTAVSVNAGASQQQDLYEDETVFRWGARLEHRWEGMPLTTYLAYQGQSWDGEMTELGGNLYGDWTWDGMEHAVYVGLRVPFGNDTLQDLDRRAGLMDLNPLYGEALPH